MDKLRSWGERHKRRLIQLYAALLYNAHLKGFIEGDIYTGSVKNLCVPGLNCYSCPGAVGACPLGALQNALASTGTRAPYYILGILMLFGVTLGRTVCGWLCPMGLLQELLHKIPVPKLGKSCITRILSWTKYIILVIFVILIPLFYGIEHVAVPAFCKYICPAGTLEGGIGLLANPANSDKMSMLGALFTRKYVILVLILTACMFIYRAFCRFLCPLGAIYGLFNRISLMGVRVNPAKCNHCGKCVRNCRMDVCRVGDHECIHCGKCMQDCPTKAIEQRTRLPKQIRRVASILAIFILCAALVGFNLPSEESIDIGYEVGMQCPDFSAPLYDHSHGGTFELSQTRGKVTVINFWATWCGPCVTELPYFQAIQDEYGESVAVVAIHSNLVTEDVEAYLDAQDYTLDFALDEDGGIIASLGGSTMLPMTVILDQDGKIVYNQVGSVTNEKLRIIIEPLIGG